MSHDSIPCKGDWAWKEHLMDLVSTQCLPHQVIQDHGKNLKLYPLVVSKLLFLINRIFSSNKVQYVNKANRALLVGRRSQRGGSINLPTPQTLMYHLRTLHVPSGSLGLLKAGSGTIPSSLWKDQCSVVWREAGRSALERRYVVCVSR